MKKQNCIRKRQTSASSAYIFALITLNEEYTDFLVREHTLETAREYLNAIVHKISAELTQTVTLLGT
jgi:hypothetical protein